MGMSEAWQQPLTLFNGARKMDLQGGKPRILGDLELKEGTVWQNMFDEADDFYHQTEQASIAAYNKVPPCRREEPPTPDVETHLQLLYEPSP
jgi:hypothetical protein